MVNILLALQYLFPGTTTRDYIVALNADGKPYIEQWNMPIPIPSDEELMAAELAALKEKKIYELNRKCNAEILRGFTSASTGHRFSFGQEDQANLTQQMLLLLNDPNLSSVEWKTEDSGVQTFTREQFLSIVKEAEAHKRSLMAQYWKKKANVLESSDRDTIKAMEW
jgi:hypothetical protein